MMVEDHPYDYRNFEGIIPAGNYGGGTVMVWDEGTYEPEEGDGLTTKEHEKLLLKKLYAGDLKIVLHGKKIRGSYALVKLKRDEKSWLLIKHKDEFAADEDITQKNKSVKSGKTLAQIAADNGAELNHPDDPTSGVKKIAAPAKRNSATTKNAATKKASVKKGAPKKTATRKKKALNVKELLGENFSLVKQKPMPKDLQPMLATLVNEPFDNEQWLFEIKWDGYRALAYLNDGLVEMISRNNKSFTEKYYPIAEGLIALGLNAVFDGEIVAIDEKGLANFQALQNWQNTPVKLQFFVFDIIWLEGYDVTALPLIERKNLLQKILSDNDEIVRYSDHVTGEGKDFFDVAIQRGLEGIMAKKISSLYQLDSRAETWLKIKVNLRQEVIIAGFTEPRKTRKFFGALLLGVYDGKELVYVGHTGSGFNKKSLEEIYNQLQPLVVEACPFTECPKGNMPVTWVEPQLICEIKFTEWTKERIARHPIFMGLRTDKKPVDVRFEKSITINTMIKKATSKKAAKKTTPAKNAAPKKGPTKAQTKKGATAKTSGVQLSLEEGKDQTVIVDKHELQLTSLDKLYWKKEGRTKMDSLNYYFKIAPYILPYMLNRPQSLNRHPNGIDAANFYQKDMKGKLPEWMETHTDFSESTNKNVEYLVCNNEATLIYMANLGCIEMHPWHSRSQSWQQPDWCLIDLDPDKGNTFDEVIQIAQIVKRILDSIGADCCVKTSGSSGIHIYIPLGAKYSYDQSKQLAELVVTMVNNELPDVTSIERNPAKRKGKIYLDYLQNRETQTAAAPYSLRPKRGMPVSTPLHWDEVKKGLTPTTYNMDNIFDRLKKEGDLFSPVLGKGIDLQKVLRKLETITT